SQAVTIRPGYAIPRALRGLRANGAGMALDRCHSGTASRQEPNPDIQHNINISNDTEYYPPPPSCRQQIRVSYLYVPRNVACRGTLGAPSPALPRPSMVGTGMRKPRAGIAR